MKIKVYVVDLEVSPRVKRWGIRAGILALLVGTAAVAIAATPLHPFAKDETLTADNLNGNFSNLETRLAAIEATVHPASGFHAALSKAQTIPTTLRTTVTFDTVEFDTANEYNKTTGGFSPAQAGVYTFSCTLDINVPANTTVYGTIRKNGADLVGSDVTVSTAGYGGPSVSVITRLVVGDTVTCAAYQASGGSLPLYVGSGLATNSFSGARLN